MKRHQDYLAASIVSIRVPCRVIFDNTPRAREYKFTTSNRSAIAVTGRKQRGTSLTNHGRPPDGKSESSVPGRVILQKRLNFIAAPRRKEKFDAQQKVDRSTQVIRLHDRRDRENGRLFVSVIRRYEAFSRHHGGALSGGIRFKLRPDPALAKRHSPISVLLEISRHSPDLFHSEPHKKKRRSTILCGPGMQIAQVGKTA